MITMNPEYYNSENFLIVTFIAGMFAGTFGALCAYIHGKIWHKILLKQIKNKYPNEKIGAVCAQAFRVSITVSFIFFAFFTVYILPFFIYSNLERLDNITRFSAPYYTVACIFSLLYILFRAGSILVLTNKRLLVLYPFNLKKHFGLPIKNIKGVKLNIVPVFSNVTVIKKNDEEVILGPYPEIKGIYKILDEHFKRKMRNG